MPLSAAQRRLWYLNQLGQDGPYHTPLALRMDGPLDVSALRAAVVDVINRHQALRTVYPAQTGEPGQQVLEPGAAPAGFHLAACPADALDVAIGKANRQPIDITTEPPVHAWLYEVEPGKRHVLLVVMHQIAGDAWSAEPFLRDLGTAYAARRARRTPRFEPISVEYLDYCRWRSELQGSAEDPGSMRSAQLRYWTAALAGLPEEITLPADRPRPAEPCHRGDVVRFVVPAGLHARLTELAADTRTTLLMVLQAGLAVLLTRLGAGTDIPIGSTVSGRPDTATGELVGAFANTLVLRTDTSGEPTFRELLARVRDTDLAAFANRDVPFERVLEAVGPTRSPARHPLFQVLLTLRDAAAALPVFPGLSVSRYPVPTRTARVDLAAGFIQTRDASGRPGGLHAALEYEVGMFDRDTVAALATRLVRLLAAAATGPDTPIGAIGLLDETERHTVLVDWNDTARPVSDRRCLHELFEDQVERGPDATALVFNDSEVSYADLNAKANQLARYLVRHGVRRGQLVGIYLDRSPILIAAVLAVLKVGGTYVMLDPKLPAEHLLAVLEETTPATVITIGGRSARLAAAKVDLLRLDVAMVGRIAHEAEDNLGAPGAPDEPACVLLTATRSRAVIASHRALVSTFLGRRYLRCAPDEVFLQCSPVSAASFALEVFGALLFGGAVVLQPGHQAEPSAMALLVARHEVTTLVLPARLFELLVDEYPGVFRVARQVLMLGEPASVSHVLRALREFPNLHLLNAYGAAETLGLATILPVSEPDVIAATTVPIGRPVAANRAYVLDSALRPVPTGVVGELYLGGAGLASGYLGRPDLTAARFVANPFGGHGERLWRTGDLARWRRGGVLELVGREADQVRVRGFAVHPAVIESALAAHPTVAQAAVVVWADRVVAYVVAADGRQVAVGALREYVSGSLPEPIIPAFIDTLDALPLTVNGRLDRSALPALNFANLPTGRPPRTPQEKTMCELFCDVLGLPEVGIDDSFLDLGGHSLLATRLIGRIRSTFGAELNIRTVFESPTVAGLIERLAGE
jgi:amino acid adenylation domain-containing protein